MNSVIMHISVSSLVLTKNSLTEVSQCHLHFRRWHFFCFRLYFGHKLAVLRGCRLLLYTRIPRHRAGFLHGYQGGMSVKKRKEHVLCRIVRTTIQQRFIPTVQCMITMMSRRRRASGLPAGWMNCRWNLWTRHHLFIETCLHSQREPVWRLWRIQRPTLGWPCRSAGISTPCV